MERRDWLTHAGMTLLASRLARGGRTAGKRR